MSDFERAATAAGTLAGPPAGDGYPSRAVVDLAAIRANVVELARRAGSAEVMAVVKADAYGHGLVPSARAALAGGATWLGVAQASEALALRAAGVGPDDARVLAWLLVPGSPFADLVAADVDVSLAASWAVDEVVAAARTTGRTARVHVEVETGLGRGGVVPADLDGLLAALRSAEAEGALRVVGVWSHLALADVPGDPVNDLQRRSFDEAVARVERAGCVLEVRHLANSAATVTAPGLHYDLVRPGIAVYGLSPVPELASAHDLGLVPAMTLEARLALVKPVAAGQGVSYGHLYTTERATRLGVVPLGYGDGIPRHASGGSAGPGGPLLVGTGDGARLLRVAGRVCMDQVVVDLGPDASERAGDVVRLFGPDAAGPTAQDWADAAGTISYEITTRLGARVPRVHVGAPTGGTDPA